MTKEDKKPIRCAIYTRKSTQEGLEQEFNSLDAQREAGEAYIKSQKHEHWTLLPKHYDDGGFSGGSLERPALHALISDIKKGLIDVVGIRNIGLDDMDGLVLKHIQTFIPKDWHKLSLQEKRIIVKNYVEKVVLHKEKIDVVIKTENGPEAHSVPMLLRKYGRKKLVLDAQGKEIAPTRGNKDKALINALVRAHKWEKALTSGSEKSLGTIAKAEDLEQKYVTRIYRLNFLAPKIKEAILDGMQPGTLTLSRLMQDIPLSWQEQEHLYGF